MCIRVVSIASKIGSLPLGKHADLAIIIADSGGYLVNKDRVSLF